MHLTKFSAFFGALFFIAFANPALAQTSNGLVTTAEPTYTNGTPAPLSLDTDGGLRVNCETGCSASGSNTDFGDPFPTSGPGVGFIDGSGDMAAGTLDVDGNIQTTVCDTDGQCAGVFGTSLDTRVTSTTGLTDTQLRATPVDTSNVDLTFDASDNLAVTVCSTNCVTVLPSSSAGLSADHNPIVSTALSYVFDGSDWERWPGTEAGGGLVTVPDQATSNFSGIMANTTNSTSVKASAGTLYELSVYNNSEAIAYLKLYNSASAPTCGSGTPVARYLIPGGANGAGSNVNISLGKSFSTGIGFCVTAAIGDSDTTAVAADDYIVNLTYR